MQKHNKFVAFFTAGLVAACLARGAIAAEFTESVKFNIESQALETALLEFSRQAGIQVFGPSEGVSGKKTSGIQGEKVVEEALKLLLKDSGLTYRMVNKQTVAIGPMDGSATAWSESDALRLAQDGSVKKEDATAGGAGRHSPVNQESETPTSSELKEIIVTAKRKFRPETSNAASKFELPIIETPQALTVISSEFLNIARLNDTASVVAYTPGVELQGMGDGTQAGISARGFQVNRERGFRINGLSTDSEIDLDYFAIDRVEVVRGPASSLYGEADYGATFNRVLKSPTGKFGATTSAEFGSYDLRRLQADVQGPLSGSGTVSARATAAVQDSGTFIKGTQDNRVLISPSLSIDLDETKVLVQAYHQKLTGASSDGFPLIFDGSEYRLPQLPRRNNYGADINRIDSQNQFVFSRVDRRLSDTLDLSLKAGHSSIKMQNVSSFLFGAGTDGNSPLYYFPESKTKKDLSFDVSLEKKLEMGEREQRFLLSADWRKNSYHEDVFGFFPLGTIDLFNGGPLSNYDPTPLPLPARYDGQFWSSQQYYSGVTALAHLKPTERLALLLGMRYSAIKTSVRNYVPLYETDTTISGLKDNDWVPRAAAVYTLTKGHNVYLSYSEGIIFNQSYLRADGSPVNPEIGVQYEVGLKGELFDRRVMYSAALFQITRTNIAAGIFTPGQPDVYYNVGKQVHRGGEFEIIGEPIPGLNLVASYSNLDVDIRESANPLQVGQRPFASPAHSYSLFATYEILKGPLRSLTFGGGLVARSEREVDLIGTFQLPSYTRIDLRASYNLSDSILLEFNLQNAFNERIYTSIYYSPDLGVAYAYPRAAFGRISYRW